MPKNEPRVCDGCRKRFKDGDQRIEDPDSTAMGTLVYHPNCRDGALWNHMGLIDKETREALVKRVSWPRQTRMIPEQEEASETALVAMVKRKLPHGAGYPEASAYQSGLEEGWEAALEWWEEQIKA